MDLVPLLEPASAQIREQIAGGGMYKSLLWLLGLVQAQKQYYYIHFLDMYYSPAS